MVFILGKKRTRDETMVLNTRDLYVTGHTERSDGWECLVGNPASDGNPDQDQKNKELKKSEQPCPPEQKKNQRATCTF